MNNKLWAGIALIFLAILWVAVFEFGGNNSVEYMEWRAKTYDSNVRAISGLIMLAVRFYPSYIFAHQGFKIIKSEASQ